MAYEVAPYAAGLVTSGPTTAIAPVMRLSVEGFMTFPIPPVVANRYGITIPGSTGPQVPTSGQVFPRGR